MNDKKGTEHDSGRQSRDGRTEARNKSVESEQKKRYEIKIEGDDEQEAAPQERQAPPEVAPQADDYTPEAPGSELEMALSRLEEAEDLVRKHQDDVLRTQAEMQNLRRRTEQDIEKAHKYGQERFITEMLPVIDNLERALEAAQLDNDGKAEQGPAQDKLKAIRDGVDLTLKSFLDCFRKFNIEPINPLGEPFDPQLHQAMATVQDDKVEPNTVTAVVQKGYLLHGRVLRPAMVMVSK